MKLVSAVVQDYDVSNLVRAIVKSGLRATVIGSTGGFLMKGNTTIISAVDDDRVPDILSLIATHCRERTEIVRPDAIGDYADWYPPHEVEVIVGGAHVFVLPIVRFERIA